MDYLRELRPLLTAEAEAESYGVGLDAADVEQGVWLRLLERTRREGPPTEPAVWLRGAVRSEVRSARRRARREVPYGSTAPEQPAHGPGAVVEPWVLAAETDRALHAAVRRLPGRCPRLLAALLSRRDPTYREIAGELGMSQGSLGPVRSRCLGCLRRMLMAEVAAPDVVGMGR